VKLDRVVATTLKRGRVAKVETAMAAETARHRIAEEESLSALR